MTKSELLEKIEQEKSFIEGWGIVLGYLSNAGYIMGCYYDEKENVWKIYDTDERGIKAVYFQADSEEEAYDKLFDLLMFNKELSSKNH